MLSLRIQMSVSPWRCKSDAALHSSLFSIPCLFIRLIRIHTNTHEAVTFSSATLTLHIHDPTSIFLSLGVAFPFNGARDPYVCTCPYNHQHKPLSLLPVGKHPYSISHLFIYQLTLFFLSEAQERLTYGGLTKGNVWCLGFTCLCGPGRLMNLVVDTCHVASRCFLGFLSVFLSVCTYEYVALSTC